MYYKPDVNFGGVQGGAMPWVVEQPADEVAVDPYGEKSTEFVVTEEFERMWTSALAHCHKRFEGKRPLYKKAPTGGIGAFTADSFPVFDRFVDNAYVIADSNHGYKMIGVGALVAGAARRPQALLEPFRFSRFAEGRSTRQPLALSLELSRPIGSADEAPISSTSPCTAASRRSGSARRDHRHPGRGGARDRRRARPGSGRRVPEDARDVRDRGHGRDDA